MKEGKVGKEVACAVPDKLYVLSLIAERPSAMRNATWTPYVIVDLKSKNLWV